VIITFSRKTLFHGDSFKVTNMVSLSGYVWQLLYGRNLHQWTWHRNKLINFIIIDLESLTWLHKTHGSNEREIGYDKFHPDLLVPIFGLSHALCIWVFYCVSFGSGYRQKHVKFKCVEFIPNIFQIYKICQVKFLECKTNSLLVYFSGSVLLT